MFEHKTEPLLPKRAFIGRMAAAFAAGGVVVVVALVAGATGYRLTEGMPWLDSFLNAAMILTGMGPVDRLEHDGAKVFAICYAIASGFILLTVGAFILGPALHRLLHAIHVEEDSTSAGQ